jgi:BirA family biotin operon repressor/biotin-[acetyl-CoA-carboxylase] ligase
LGKTIYEYEEVASTQDILKKELTLHSPNGLVILAKRQNKGRGRLGRSWIDIPGEQIFSSLLIWSPLPVSKLPLLNIAVGLAVCEALESLGIKNVGIKWPNDVYIFGKKVCGILSEVVQVQKMYGIMLGIGLNVEGKNIPQELREIATTLEQHLTNPDRLFILSKLLHFIEKWVEIFEKEGPNPIQEEFKQKYIYSGLSTTVDFGKEKVTGIATEIDQMGALLLNTDKGIRRIV